MKLLTKLAALLALACGPELAAAQQPWQFPRTTGLTVAMDTSVVVASDSNHATKGLAMTQLRKLIGVRAFDSLTVTGPLHAKADSATGAARAQTLTTARALWGQNFDGSGAISGSLTGVANITGGASSMTVQAGTGASRQMALQTTTSGSTATTFLRGNELQQSLFADGAVGTPGIGFAADSLIGWFRKGTAGANDTLSASANGVLQATLTSTGSALRGATTNSSAAAGFVGEYISGARATGVSLTLTTATPLTVDSVSLTAGDWDVSGTVSYTFAATTSYSNLVGCVSTTTNNVTTGAGQGACYDYETAANVPTATADATWVVPTTRVSLASTTVVFITTNQTFTLAALKGYGTIRARRVR